MNVRIDKSFEKDVSKLKDPRLLDRIAKQIIQIKRADSLTEIRSLKQLTGEIGYYRIRIGDYRIGLKLIGNSVVFIRFLHRKEIYRYFP